MNFLVNLFSSGYQELWKAIIRPMKDEYTDKDLGPERFRINSRYYKRTDFSLVNNRNIKLECSYWEPYDEERELTHLPCVVYLHGNSSSRCEVVPNLKYLLPLNITVFAFDFAGCGHSEGEYISLGWYENLDVKCIIDFLRNSNKVSTIGLWGRSMGAVTSIMYASRDPTIGGIFLDSPFYSLNLLIDELSNEKVSFPNFLVRQVVKMLKATVKEKAEFNIDDIEPVEYAKKCFVPAFFCHGKDDSFVDCHHCKDLYLIYPGEKNILLIEGDHNDLRPDKLNEKAAEFFYNALKCKYIRELNDSYLGYKLFFRDWNNPNFRTPKGDNDKKIKIKNVSFNAYRETKSFDYMNFPKKNNSQKEIKKNYDYNVKKFEDKNNNNEKKKYKFRNYYQKNANNINNNENVNNEQNNNIKNNNYKKINENIFIKNHPSSSSKDLYNFKTHERQKKEGHQRTQKYDFSQPQRYIKPDSNNQNKIKNKEMMKTKTQNMSMNGRYFNNEFKTFYDNNDSNNIYDNSKKENEHIKKINVRQISENKVMRNYISPKANIRYQYPAPSILNQSEISSNSPKTIQSMSHAFIANNNNKKNNSTIKKNFMYNNNNSKMLSNNIYYNMNNSQMNGEYSNNYNVYNNQFGQSQEY